MLKIFFKTIFFPDDRLSLVLLLLKLKTSNALQILFLTSLSRNFCKGNNKCQRERQKLEKSSKCEFEFEFKPKGNGKINCSKIPIQKNPK